MRAKDREPRKWLGRFGGFLIGAAFAVLWLYLLLVVVVMFGDSSPVQTVLIISGFGVAAGFLYTMCYRLRPQDRLSPAVLLLIFLIGGFASTIIPICVEPVVRVIAAQAGGNPGLVLSIAAGPIEEFSKILIVVLAAHWVPIRNARIGLFVGGAVGFGFSGFEDLEYGLSAISGHGSPNVGHLVMTVLAREASGPFAHPLWTSLLAAAVYAAWRSRRVRITWRVVGVYVLVAAAHSLWDTVSPAWYLLFGSQFASNLAGFVAIVLLAAGGTLVWWTVARRARREADAGPDPDAHSGVESEGPQVDPAVETAPQPYTRSA